MHRHYPGLVHRLAAALIGGVIATLVAASPQAVAQLAPILEVASPAEGATLHSLEVTVRGKVNRIDRSESWVVLCVADRGETLGGDNADVDDTTGAFRLTVPLPPYPGEYVLTIQALEGTVPASSVCDPSA